jgi:hypothetical protein
MPWGRAGWLRGPGRGGAAGRSSRTKRLPSCSPTSSNPDLDDLTRRAKVGSRHAATEIGLGLLLGLYGCRDVDDNELLLTHAGMPDAVDDLTWQVRSAMTASGLDMPEGWVAEECPDWQP